MCRKDLKTNPAAPRPGDAKGDRCTMSTPCANDRIWNAPGDPDSFDAFISAFETPVLVDFWARWCAPCKRFAPVLEEAEGRWPDCLQIVKVDVSNDRSLADRFGVQTFPTVIAFKDGAPAAEPLAGSQNVLNDLDRYLKDALGRKWDAAASRPVLSSIGRTVLIESADGEICLPLFRRGAPLHRAEEEAPVLGALGQSASLYLVLAKESDGKQAGWCLEVVESDRQGARALPADAIDQIRLAYSLEAPFTLNAQALAEAMAKRGMGSALRILSLPHNMSESGRLLSYDAVTAYDILDDGLMDADLHNGVLERATAADELLPAGADSRRAWAQMLADGDIGADEAAGQIMTHARQQGLTVCGGADAVRSMLERAARERLREEALDFAPPIDIVAGSCPPKTLADVLPPRAVQCLQDGTLRIDELAPPLKEHLKSADTLGCSPEHRGHGDSLLRRLSVEVAKVALPNWSEDEILAAGGVDLAIGKTQFDAKAVQVAHQQQLEQRLVGEEAAPDGP